MTRTLAIRNCRVLMLGELVEANILIEGEKIVAITRKEPEADSYYDARGMIALPGCVDVHVHFRDPSSNMSEDFASGTLAAAHGGVTTVADMPNTEPPVTSAEVLRSKLRVIESKAYVDYALIGGVGKGSTRRIAEQVEAGAVAVKTFMTGRFPELCSPDAETLRLAIAGTREAGVPLMVHAEDLSALGESPEGGPISYAIKRGCACEIRAVETVSELARQLEGWVHFVHISCGRSLEIANAYKRAGVRITVETEPHYLSLTMEEMRRRGPYAKIDPPLRTKADVERLLLGLVSGEIDIVASDHAPYERRDKDRGFEDIELAPSGIPGVETVLPFLLDLCFRRGILSLDAVVDLYSGNPARFLRLYPKKGSLSPGSDADIVLVDHEREFVVSEENLFTRTKQSMLEGWKFRGTPISTFVRGSLVMEEGQVVSGPRGVFQKPLK